MLKKSWLLACICTVFLTACPSEPNQPIASNDNMASEVASDNTTLATPLPHPKSIEMQYSQLGQEQTALAFPQKSEQLAYQVYLPSGFLLSGEEPGKDVVISDLSESSMMRLEVVVNHDKDTYQYLLNAMQDGLAASIPDATIETLKPKLPESMQNTKIAQVKNKQLTVTGMVFEQDDLMVRATIFSDNDADLSGAFVQMASTIRQSQ